jgi:hypothetical protein
MKFYEYGMGKILIYFSQPMIFKKPIEQLISVTMPDGASLTYLTSYILKSMGSNATCYNMYLVTWVPFADFVKARSVNYPKTK